MGQLGHYTSGKVSISCSHTCPCQQAVQFGTGYMAVMLCSCQHPEVTVGLASHWQCITHLVTMAYLTSTCIQLQTSYLASLAMGSSHNRALYKCPITLTLTYINRQQLEHFSQKNLLCWLSWFNNISLL